MSVVLLIKNIEMKMLILTHFCCGCSLKTGSIIVGLLDLIISIGNVALYQAEVEEGLPTYLQYLIIIVNIFSFMASIALIYGVLKQDKLQFILPWLFFYVIYVPVFILVGTTLTFYFLAVPQVAFALEILVYVSFAVAFLLYGFLTVYSHYRNVEDQLQLPPTPVYFLV